MKPGESQPGLIPETHLEVAKLQHALGRMGIEPAVGIEEGAVVDEHTAHLAVDGLRKEARSTANFALRKTLKHPIRYVRDRGFRYDMRWHREDAEHQFDIAQDWENMLVTSHAAVEAAHESNTP